MLLAPPILVSGLIIGLTCIAEAKKIRDSGALSQAAYRKMRGLVKNMRFFDEIPY
ncbi:MAG: hypothetical protein MUP16_04620 [Sedimentisphaerales bacterium]|nr:hypothetical protein [Sedimentisphaerales bacterium]